jgi:shikimate kinase
MTGPPTTRLVFLIGFMGAGKTSVGKALAELLGWKFHDLDAVIEVREGATVDAIFASAGEAGFRRAESAALLDLLERDLAHGNAIVALGGGTFAQPGNREALQQTGAITVLLDAPLEELERRCRNAPNVRPLAREKSRFHQLFADRRAAYLMARFRVDTSGKEIEQVAREVGKILQYDSGQVQEQDEEKQPEVKE